jgi:hypothetical protein
VTSVVNIRCSTFVDELPDLLHSAEQADTLVRCADGGARRVHSLVLAAASSLLRAALADAATAGGGEGPMATADYLILMPDLTLAELDAMLGPLYGDIDSSSSTNSGTAHRDVVVSSVGGTDPPNLFCMDFNRGLIAAAATSFLPIKAEDGKEQRFFQPPLLGSSGDDDDNGGDGAGPRTDTVVAEAVLRPRRRGGRKRKKRSAEEFLDDAEEEEDEENINPAVSKQKMIAQGDSKGWWCTSVSDAN